MSADLTAPGLTPEPEEVCPSCASCDLGVIIEGREAQWATFPPVAIEDRRTKCNDCGEEWFDPEQANRHSVSLMKATLAWASARLTALEADRERLEEVLASLIGEMRFRDGQYRPIANTFMTGDTRKLSPRQRAILKLRRDPEMERILAESLGEHPREVTPKSTEHTDNG